MPAFVDKTLMIDTVLRNELCILLMVPRRFGKSTNISMLKHFFKIVPHEKVMKANRKLFEGLLIEQCQETMSNHFGKYPVIFLDFRSSNSIRSFDDAFEHIRVVCTRVVIPRHGKNNGNTGKKKQLISHL